MVSARERRQQEREAKEKKERASAMQAERRKDPQRKFAEERQRLLRRIRDGQLPQVDSLEKYKVSIDLLNTIREEAGHEAVSIDDRSVLSYYARAQRVLATDGRGIPDNSEIFGGFGSDDDSAASVEGQEQQAPAAAPRAAAPARTVSEPLGFSVADIALYLQKNPGKASGKTADDLKPRTTKDQWGTTKTDGSFSKTGRFYKFMMYLGDEYLRDVRAVRAPGFLTFLRGKVFAQRYNDETAKTNPGGKMGIDNTLFQLASLLKALRQYPKFDALKNREYTRIYNAIDKVYTELKLNNEAIKFANPPKDKPVEPFEDVKKRIIQKYPDPLSRENLFISLYAIHPGRDDYANLRVFSKETDRLPTSPLDLENLKDNAIYVKADMRKAKMYLVNYKTSGIYGTQVLEFDEKTTETIKKYIQSPKYRAPHLFGKAKMSSWIGKLLESVNVDRKGRNVNYLRQSFITSNLFDVGNQTEERLRLAFHLRHSPSAQVKYIKELVRKDEYAPENISGDELEKLVS